ncbi:MAG: hypothetical protein J0H02_00565 [Armatimonadetes bacterium]|nr:hypothetical protein [Armatimonadota bacterium]
MKVKSNVELAPPTDHIKLASGALEEVGSMMISNGSEGDSPLDHIDFKLESIKS